MSLLYYLLIKNLCVSDHKRYFRLEAPSCRGITHTVQPGETLWFISRKYSVTVDQIIAENPQITNPNMIFIGQVVCIPCVGTVFTIQPGDTLWRISQIFKVTVQEILAANPQITNPDVIHVGQVICIPKSSHRLSLTYLFGATSARYLEMLSLTRNSLNTVCPYFFTSDRDGNLLLAAPESLNHAFINVLHRQGNRVVPFFSNHFNRELGIRALNNRNRLSDQIAGVVERYNLDGIDINIENVTHEHRDMYTDFMRLLREKIPRHKIVSTPVAANPRGFTLGWHGSYDYPKLAHYCDYITIMNYDESYPGSPEGPVSSSSFFERSIQYALEQGVTKDKIVVNIPFFGRYWQQGAAAGGIGLANRDVEFLLANYESTHRYDVATQSAHAIVTIKPGDREPIIWGGRRLTAGTYSIWYDSPESTRFKLEIINKYDVLGAGSWALGQEILSIWNFYTQVLNA